MTRRELVTKEATMTTEPKIHRICPGHYQVSGVPLPRSIHILSIWKPEWEQDMWHVVVDGASVESHSYLRHAKEAALKEARR